jgi:hypothetical protein
MKCPSVGTPLRTVIGQCKFTRQFGRATGVMIQFVFATEEHNAIKLTDFARPEARRAASSGDVGGCNVRSNTEECVGSVNHALPRCNHPRHSTSEAGSLGWQNVHG